MGSVRAFLDDKDKIVLYVPYYYYQGKASFFYVRNHTLSGPYQVVETGKYADGVIYQLTLEEPLTLGQEVFLLTEYGATIPLEIRFYVQTKHFQENYTCADVPLGCFAKSEQTTFRLWAPTATQVLLRLDQEIIPLKRVDKGIWEYVRDENLDKAEYDYLVKVNDLWQQTPDPYGISCTTNHQKSVVMSLLEVPEIKPCREAFFNPCEAIIYETSVRDFTMDPNIPFTHPGKFASFAQQGLKTAKGSPAGFDHLKQLEITHLQLMPIQDFASVPEENPSVLYNWGYDPVSWFCLEGSYATEPTDPYSRIREFATLVNKCHEENLRVVVDVVYNHVFDAGISPFEKTVPFYYFRHNPDGTFANGSFCGNDFASERIMARKVILDSIKLLFTRYGIDGLRFDLMGNLDIETLNTVAKEVKAIRPDALLYGEGWDMPTILPYEDKAIIANNAKMGAYGFFNSAFRDTLKGSTDEYHLGITGYLTGDLSRLWEAFAALSANTTSLHPQIYQNPTQSISYLECHDNHTLWDKMAVCVSEESEEEKILRQKLAIGTILIAQGIPFLHSGMEFCRSKQGIGNSYRSPDSINALDYSRLDTYWSVNEYTRELIALRKELKVFSFGSGQEVSQHLSFEALDGGILLMKISDVKGYCCYSSVWVYLNPSTNDQKYAINGTAVLLANHQGRQKTSVSGSVSVPARSLVVVGIV
ncbi:MAG: type I pullulanase [Erysipelotrichaceae bacterium]|jgi:pullulanase|nr:type I pullulanase [Erysipelotrichaceae bacterium]